MRHTGPARACAKSPEGHETDAKSARSCSVSTLRRMSCRRKASTATSASSPPSATADVGDRELSAAAQARVEKKKAVKPAAGGAAAPAFPVAFFSAIFLFFLAALYLTIKYS